MFNGTKFVVINQQISDLQKTLDKHIMNVGQSLEDLTLTIQRQTQYIKYIEKRIELIEIQQKNKQQIISELEEDTNDWNTDEEYAKITQTPTGTYQGTPQNDTETQPDEEPEFEKDTSKDVNKTELSYVEEITSVGKTDEYIRVGNNIYRKVQTVKN